MVVSCPTAEIRLNRNVASPRIDAWTVGMDAKVPLGRAQKQRVSVEIALTRPSPLSQGVRGSYTGRALRGKIIAAQDAVPQDGVTAAETVDPGPLMPGTDVVRNGGVGQDWV